MTSPHCRWSSYESSVLSIYQLEGASSSHFDFSALICFVLSTQLFADTIAFSLWWTICLPVAFLFCLDFHCFSDCWSFLFLYYEKEEQVILHHHTYAGHRIMYTPATILQDCVSSRVVKTDGRELHHHALCHFPTELYDVTTLFRSLL